MTVVGPWGWKWVTSHPVRASSSEIHEVLLKQNTHFIIFLHFLISTDPDFNHLFAFQIQIHLRFPRSRRFRGSRDFLFHFQRRRFSFITIIQVAQRLIHFFIFMCGNGLGFYFYFKVLCSNGLHHLLRSWRLLTTWRLRSFITLI